MGRKNNQEVSALTVKDLKMLFKDGTNNHRETVQAEPTSNTVNLRELPPSVAAAAAAEARLRQARNVEPSQA